MGLDVFAVINKAMDRGYVLHNYITDQSRLLTFTRYDGLELTVYLNNETFELFYTLDSVFRVTSGKLKGFTDDKLFKEYEEVINTYINKLK